MIWVKRAFRVAAAAFAAALLFGLFVGGAQPVAVGLVPVPWDKLAHATVFAILAICIGCGSGLRARPMFIVSFLASACIGAFDEWHQMYLPGRGADWQDVVFDAAGAALGSAALNWRSRVESWVINHAEAVKRR